jgi:hypothetical protein
MADNYQRTSKQQNDHASAAAREAAEAVHQGIQALQRGGYANSEALRQASAETAEATQRGGEAASETMRRNAQAFAESQREFLQKSVQQFEAVSRKVANAAQGNTENLRTLMTLPNTAQGGLRDLQQSMASLVEGVMRTNVRAAQELFRLTNPSALVELQQRFVREYLDALLQGTANLVRASRRTADETLRPLEQQIEQRRQTANQGQYYNKGQHYLHYSYAAE